MQHSSLSSVLALLGAVSVFTFLAGAQQPVNTMQGLNPSGTYQTGSVDTVNLMNGGLTIVIPLGGSAPQRGAVSAQVEVVMNSKGFYIANGQWHGSGMNTTITNAWRIQVQQVTINGTPTYEAITPDGSIHILEGNVQVNGVNQPGYWAIDGSGIQFSSATDIAINRDGIQTVDALNNTNGPATIDDSNGNEISLTNAFTYSADTVGRSGGNEAPTTDTSGCTGTGTLTANTITFPGYNGNIETYKLCYETVSVITHFGVSGVAEENSKQQMLTTIIRPDGTAWSFTYSLLYTPGLPPAQWNFGDLESMTLPTGGTINYQWTTHQYFSYGPTPTNRWLIERTVDADNGRP